MASRIIKGGDAASEVPLSSAPVPVFDPRLEAEQLLRKAQAEADRIRVQATTEGRERGMAAVTELLVGARAVASRARANSAAELRLLAVRIAEKILGRELALRSEAVVDIVAEALTSAGASRQVMVRCHPDDLAALESGRPRLIERCARAQLVHFRVDGQVARGGCIVETELATIDARLSTQLDAIERALRSEGEG